MRLRGGVRRFQTGGANPLQRPQRPGAIPATPAALPPTYTGGGPMPPGGQSAFVGGGSYQPAPGAYQPPPGSGVTFPTGNGGSFTVDRGVTTMNPPGGGGGAQQGAFTAGAPGNSLGAAPGLNPAAIQQALQMRRSMAGGPPAMGGPAGAPAGGWPGAGGMPPGAAMQRPPMGMPPGGSMGPLPPGASMQGMPPQGMPPQGMQGMPNPQQMAQIAAMMQAQGAQPTPVPMGPPPVPPAAMAGRPAGMARGGAVEDGDTDVKKARPDRQWGKRVAAEDIPEAPVKKAKGGQIKRRRPPAPPKIAKARPPLPMTPGGDDADALPPPAAPAVGAGPVGAPPVGLPGMKKGGAVHGKDCDCADCAGKMAKGGKWIQGAIKHPGALHKRLGIPEDKTIPAKTLNKAAQKGGTLGKEANLAKTLKGFKKAKGGECDEKKMAKGGISKFNSTKPAPGNLATHPGGKKFAAGGVAKVRRGFPNVNAAPKRLAKGGTVRGCGAATKGCKFSGVY